MTPRLVTISDPASELHPHLLGHYQTLGVSEATVHAPSEEWRWRLVNNTGLYAASRAASPEDWFILADHDEFHAYPDEISKILSYCDHKGFDFIEGCLIDRMAESGRLEPVAVGTPIWKQFPIGAIVTASVTGGAINKIVACKGHVRVRTGQHLANGRGCPVSEVYVPVHHFKWTAGLTATLRTRSTQPLWSYSRECKRALDHIESNGGIDLSATGMMAGQCAPAFPYWPDVQARRIATPHLFCEAGRPRDIFKK